MEDEHVHAWVEVNRDDNDDRIRTKDLCSCGVVRYGCLAKRFDSEGFPSWGEVGIQGYKLDPIVVDWRTPVPEKPMASDQFCAACARHLAPGDPESRNGTPWPVAELRWDDENGAPQARRVAVCQECFEAHMAPSSVFRIRL